MKCTILHEGKGRMRVHVEKVRMTLHRADVLEAYLNHNDAIVHATVYERTGDVVITYTGKRSAAVALLAGYKFDVAEYDALVTSADSRKLNREYQDKMFNLVAGRCLRKLFLPAPIAAAYTAFRSIGFIWKGVRCVLRRKLEVEVLDALSIGVSMLRGDFATAGSVMFLLNLGSLLEEWTRKKSLDDLARSMALNVDKVWVRSQGTEVLMPLTKVRTGDQVVVRSGNMIPLDGTVLEGEAMVNQAALTGESMPVSAAEGDAVCSGCVNLSGAVELVVTKPASESTASKIMELVEESASSKAKTEQFITKFARYYTPCVVIAALILAVVPPLIAGQPFSGWIYRALTFLIISCPCALVISVPLSFFGGIGCASKNGVLVKGSNYLEALSHAQTVVMDKTGTLTEGKFHVTRQKAVEITPEEQLELAALAESASNHPIAQSLKEAYGKAIDTERVEDVQEIAGHGVLAQVDGRRVAVGNRRLMERQGVSAAPCELPGTIVYVAAGNTDGNWYSSASGCKRCICRLYPDCGYDQTGRCTGSAGIPAGWGFHGGNADRRQRIGGGSSRGHFAAGRGTRQVSAGG